MTTYAKKRPRPRARVAVPKSVKSELDASKSPLTNREKRLAKANELVSRTRPFHDRVVHGGPKRGPQHPVKPGAKPKETRAHLIERFKTGKVSAKERKSMSSALGVAGDRGKLGRDFYVKVARGLGADEATAQKAADTKYNAAQKRKASYDKRINPHTGKKIGPEGQGAPGRHVDHKTGETYRADRWGKEIKGSRKKAKPLVLKQTKAKKAHGPYVLKHVPKARKPFSDEGYGGGRRRRPRFPDGPPKGYAPFHDNRDGGRHPRGNRRRRRARPLASYAY